MSCAPGPPAEAHDPGRAVPARHQPVAAVRRRRHPRHAGLRGLPRSRRDAEARPRQPQLLRHAVRRLDVRDDRSVLRADDAAQPRAGLRRLGQGGGDRVSQARPRRRVRALPPSRGGDRARAQGDRPRRAARADVRVRIVDRDGETVAEVEKTLYIRRRPAAAPPPQATDAQGGGAPIRGRGTRIRTMAIETDALNRVVTAKPASAQEEVIERALRPRGLDEYVGQEKIREQLSIFIEAARKRGEALDHVLLFGPPGPRQDHAVAHHRARAGRQPAADVGPGARAPGRPGRAADEPRAARRAVHRRDPPAVADRRGDPVPGARGLPDRHHDRRRPGRAQREARPAAVHAGRRDHARRHADQSAARPLRHRRAARVLQRRRADAHRRALGGAAQDRDRARRRARDRAPLARHAAHRQPPAAPRARLRRGERRRARSRAPVADAALSMLDVDARRAST